MNYQLDDEDIVFKYTECDGEDEGSALAFFKISDNKLKDIFNPAFYYNPHEMNVKNLIHPLTRELVDPNEYGIGIAKKSDVEKVVSVITHEDFFGLKKLNLHTDELTCWWSSYEYICRDDYEYKLLLNNGIKVLFFDLINNRFID